MSKLFPGWLSAVYGHFSTEMKWSRRASAEPAKLQKSLGQPAVGA
jgi:hypothetical protein